MQWHHAFPAEARQEGEAVIFLVRCKRRKVHDDEISKGKKCKRDGKHEEVMRLARLKNVRNGRQDVRQLRREEEFAEAAINKAKRRNGIDEDNDAGEEQKEKSRKR